VRAWPLTLLAALTLALPGLAAAATIHATKGNDRVDVVGGGRDVVLCAPGVGIITADQIDRISRNCKAVSRRISVDTLVGATGQHQTEVEPSVAANGSTAVAVFQVGRNFSGAAAEIGFAVSSDAGRSWRSGILPGITIFSTPAGSAPLASDPAVAYDVVHGVWVVSTLIVSPAFTALYISRSTDGLSWSLPVVATQATTAFLAYDKEWVACDDGTASPRRGTCYLVYTDLVGQRLALQTSTDGGQTWSAGTTISTETGAGGEGTLPLVQPDGALTVVFNLNDVGLYAVRSIDGGATFARLLGIQPITGSNVRGLRAPPLPAAAVDASGRIYLAWSDCRFRPGCAANDIVLSSSTDGASWTPPQRIPAAGIDRFVPGIAADPNVPGRLAVVTYVRTPAARIGVSVTRTNDGGATWSKPDRLDALSPADSWLANTDSGRFVGDYVGAAFASGRFVPVFALAHPPANGVLSEYMMAASLP
jgi:hypothetical protein